jgi:CysZ protein
MLASVISVTSAVPHTRKPGFFAGIRAFFQGMGFIVGTPAVWGYSLVPALIALTLFLVFATAGVIWVTQTVHETVGPSGMLALVGTYLLDGILGLVTVLVALLVGTALAQPLSGFALDAIVRKQALTMGRKLWPTQKGLGPIFRSLRVTLTALVIALPLLGGLTLTTFLFPPSWIVTFPLKLLVSGMMLAWDFLDYPFSLRGLGVRQRVRWIGQNFLAITGFAVTAATAMLIPGLGLLLLPMGVAGASRLVVESDRARRHAQGE